MAIGWLSILLKTVPWGEVISNAPAVADGAKKLWTAVARKSHAATTADVPSDSPPAAESGVPIDARLAAIEASAAELQQQMLASSDLIRTLAEQNAELVRRVEANRVRLLWLSVMVAGALAFALAALGWSLAR
jgi:hypothetical protein